VHAINNSSSSSGDWRTCTRQPVQARGCRQQSAGSCVHLSLACAASHVATACHPGRRHTATKQWLLFTYLNSAVDVSVGLLFGDHS